MKYNKDARAESINEKLLKFYGSANSLYPMRKKAMVKKKGCDEKMEVAHIVNPNLVLFGTAVPKYFYESLSRRVLENGLVARCIIVEAGKRGEAGTAMPIAPADSLLRAAKYLVDLDLQGNLAHEYPKPLIITETPDATKALREIQEECDRRYKFFESRGEGGAMALWARAHEKICKLAMLHGISSNVYDPVITEKSVKWAWKFIDHLTRRMLYMADAYVYENVFDEKCQRVIRSLRDAGGISQHSKLLKRSKESLEVFKKIIETLKANGTIDSFIEQTKTRSAVCYRLL
jgi:hypothetical protein